MSEWIFIPVFLCLCLEREHSRGSERGKQEKRREGVVWHALSCRWKARTGNPGHW